MIPPNFQAIFYVKKLAFSVTGLKIVLDLITATYLLGTSSK